ncbi:MULTISPECIES: MotA/TolQ/ExbB proton channel family protein [Marichromatium]|uniref:Outer membrane transport energization protein ExbB n=1 Tax=Marichromatium gracile TaxID=1048 RepID=A0A4R4ABW7_MARGR|nr:MULTISPECIES: MotA/TolQ/ExbB proton channel family protein [Marichromatium]MBK1710664.1 flagellar motor protein MotA [Marichromatium gracile]RNE90138.1 MotA/TolQ/ExbB proton channel family protein [Marichromatium sp. AB32]TCW36314.1 outer membrane transport energization protein ExbB [Marichromatium gracile]
MPSLDTLARLAAHTGGLLYPLALLLTLTLAVSLERGWALRSLDRRGERLARALAGLDAADRGGLAGLLEARPHAVHAALLRCALTPPETAAPAGALAARLDEHILAIQPQLDRRLWVLDTAVTLAPLLGLLGTIVGMFHAFAALGGEASGRAQAVTGGVAEALVATAAGLLIAVLGLVAFNALGERARRAGHQLEVIKVMLVNRFAGAACGAGAG